MNTSVQVHRGRSRILSQHTVADGYREIRLGLDGSIPEFNPRPGQFFTLLPPRYPRPMLRRPFAFSGVSADRGGLVRDFSFIYEIRGEATRDLDGTPTDSILDWIGPSGSVFPEPPEGSRPVIVAGGIGVGPLYFLASELAGSGFRPLVVLGARTSDLLPELKWPEGIELRVCTDDGSAGIRGTALKGIEPRDMADGVFYTCGPHPMMAAVHRLAMEGDRPCHVSMEELMACGVGACQGCAVAVVDMDSPGPSYKRACVEGPVFDSREIVW